MPDIYPIPNRAWLTRKVAPILRSMYGRSTGHSMHHLPVFNITPEHICKNVEWDVEMMLAILKCGAWLHREDWKTYSRYAINKRLRVRRAEIFWGVFQPYADQVLQYQLEGGTFKVRDALRQIGTDQIHSPLSTPREESVGRLFLSLTDDNLENCVVQPYHWIRVAVGLSDPNPVFSMTLVQSEMRRQKLTLTQFLRAKEHTSD